MRKRQPNISYVQRRESHQDRIERLTGGARGPRGRARVNGGLGIWGKRSLVAKKNQTMVSESYGREGRAELGRWIKVRYRKGPTEDTIGKGGAPSMQENPSDSSLSGKEKGSPDRKKEVDFQGGHSIVHE